MSTVSGVGKHGRRSRSGCLPCRRRHRKCDEAKPSCQQCVAAGKECEYGLRISWGGKPFAKSRFGACMTDDKSVVQVSTGSTSESAFIYGVSSNRDGQISKSPSWSSTIVDTHSASNSLVKAQSNSESTPQLYLSSLSAVSAIDSPGLPSNPSLSVVLSSSTQIHVQIPRGISWHSLPAPYIELLDYFHSITSSFSCHQTVQHDFCSIIVPMALDSSPLLASVLYLAAIHRKSAGLEQNESQLAHLQSSSVTQMRRTLSQLEGSRPNDAVLAAALTLCLCEGVAGGEKQGSWRLHLEGAIALFDQAFFNTSSTSLTATNGGAEAPRSTTQQLLWRWFISLVILSRLCGRPSLERSQVALRFSRVSDENYIDDFIGYSTTLTPIFAEIGVLLAEREQYYAAAVVTDVESVSIEPWEALPAVKERCSGMAAKVMTGITELQLEKNVQFRKGFGDSLSPDTRHDFICLDEAYHHTALMHIYGRVLALPCSSPEICSSVKRIIYLVSKMSMLKQPCPGIAVLFPLFSAGCVATDEEDRDQILDHLTTMQKLYGLYNVHRCMEFIQSFWAYREVQGDFEGHLRWDNLLVEQGIDIIPY